MEALLGLVLIFVLVVFVVIPLVKSSKKVDSLHEKQAPQAMNKPVDKTLSRVIRYDNSTRDIWGDSDSAGRAEQIVTRGLMGLGENYFIFQNVILPSSYDKVPYTEIDHIVISRTGIFCIETKSHVGYIYGYKNANSWFQYLYKKQFKFYNPLKQGYHHAKSLEKFLGSNLKSKVHSYVVFPNAKSVKVDSEMVVVDINDIVAKIDNHQQVYYDFADLERILKSIAHYDSHHREVRDRHIQGVKDYKSSKS